MSNEQTPSMQSQTPQEPTPKGPFASLVHLFRHPANGWVAIPARIYIGVIFILAAYHKIRFPEAFGLDIATYQFLPLELVNLMAITLPWVEVVVGVMLVVGWKTRANALLCAGMMVMFIIAIASALHRDINMSCGCFASAEAADDISMATIWRDVWWLVVSAYSVVVGGGHFSVDGILKKRIKKR